MSEDACSPLSPAAKPLADADPAPDRNSSAVAALDRRVWALALPAIGENLLHSAIFMADTMMIARFDPANPALLAAATVAGTILWRAHMTFGCIEKGTTALVARYSGEGNPERVGQVVAQSILLAVGIGAFLMISGFLLAGDLLRAMGARPEVVEVGTPFLRAIFLASIPRIFLFIASASLRGSGDTRTPMNITLAMNGVNLLFNWLLIYGMLGFPRLGLTGSGISTALSITFAASVISWVMLRGKTSFRLRWHHFRPDLPLIRSILRIGWPALCEEVLVSFGFLYFMSAIAHLGTEVLAAHALASRVESLSYMAGFGFAVAASTLVGQSLGSGSVALARLSFRRTTIYCVLMMSAIAVGLIVWGEHVVDVFGPENATVRHLAVMLLIVAAIEQPLLALCITLTGGMRGAGDTLTPMAVSVFGNVGVRLGICWLAGLYGWGILGIYLATVADWALRGTCLLISYRQGRWSRLRL